MKKVSKEAYEHALKIKKLYEDQNSFLATLPEEKEEKIKIFGPYCTSCKYVDTHNSYGILWKCMDCTDGNHFESDINPSNQ